MSNLEQIVRWLVFSLLLLQSSALDAQELKLKYKVEEGKISLKWLPSNYFALRKISEGATVQRIETANSSALQSLDYSKGKSWEIEPLKGRYDSLDKTVFQDEELLILFEPVVNWVRDTAEQNFAFGSNVIMNISEPRVQDILGNYIEDTNFDKSKKYAYKVSVNGLPASFLFVDASQNTTYSKIEMALNLDAQKTVVCCWDYMNLFEQSFAFDIIHCVGDTIKPLPLFEFPFLPFTTRETNSDSTSIRHENPEKGQLHFYKIIGRDAFAKSALYSDWRSIYVPNKIEVYPIIDSVSADGVLRLVNARIVNKKSADTNIKFAALLQSKNKNENYEMKVLQSYSGDSILTFKTEVETKTGDAYYYKVALINYDDSVTSQPFYYFTLDQQPPEAPKNIQITIDSTGIASLTWTSPKDKDIAGYRVFRANQISEEFIEQTQTLQSSNSFNDTLALNNLTSEIYYYITAVDENFNQGEASDTVVAFKPDTIAPMPSLIHSIMMVDHGVSLKIIASTSKDVFQTTLFRNGIEIGIIDSAYLDTSVVAGTYYSYHLRTTDKSGNTSKSEKIEQKYEPGFRAAPEFHAEVILSENHVKLTWKIPPENIYDIKIYKGKSGEPIRLWKTIRNPEQDSITDKWLSIGESYNYAIIYTTKDGIQSLKSEASIRY